MRNLEIDYLKLKYKLLLLSIVGIQCFACSAHIISPGIRSDNAATNIEKPPIIRDDKIRNDNLFVSVFIPKDKDLEEVFFDENNFASPNELLRNTLTTLWEKAKQTKNVVLIQTEDRKNNARVRQIKSIHINLKDC